MIREEYYFIAKECRQVQTPACDNGEKISNTLVSFEDFLLLSEDEQFRDADLKRVLLTIRLYPDQEQLFREMLFST